MSQLVEEGFLKILFVQPADNPSDEFTKNVSQEVHNAHMPHRLAPRESHGFGLDTGEAMEDQQDDEVIQAGRVSEMSPRISSVPHCDSSVVHLSDIIMRQIRATET